MRVCTLSLRDFRNYARAHIVFQPGSNLILGENAQGKSNLVEALRVLSTGRSRRGGGDAEMIRLGETVAYLSSEWVTGDERTVQVELGLGAGVRRYKLNGAVKSRLADWLGRVFTVLFSGDDLRVIQDAPAARREFLDSELAPLSRRYAATLHHYRRAVEQRNGLLRAARARDATRDVDAWDAEVAQHGAPLMHARAEFVARLNTADPGCFERFTGVANRLTIEYRPALRGGTDLPRDRAAIADWLRAALATNREEQIARGATLVGPHRDDLRFLLGDSDLRLFGSRGEQRAAMIVVRAILTRVVTEVTGDTPVLLLDDVFSELDEPRRAALGRALADAEHVIVTATDEGVLPPDFAARAARFHIHRGAIATVGGPA